MSAVTVQAPRPRRNLKIGLFLLNKSSLILLLQTSAASENAFKIGQSVLKKKTYLKNNIFLLEPSILSLVSIFSKKSY